MQMNETSIENKNLVAQISLSSWIIARDTVKNIIIILTAIYFLSFSKKHVILNRINVDIIIIKSTFICYFNCI